MSQFPPSYEYPLDEGASVGLLKHDQDGQDTRQLDLGLSDLAGSTSSADNTPLAGVVYL